MQFRKSALSLNLLRRSPFTQELLVWGPDGVVHKTSLENCFSFPPQNEERNKQGGSVRADSTVYAEDSEFHFNEWYSITVQHRPSVVGQREGEVN